MIDGLGSTSLLPLASPASQANTIGSTEPGAQDWFSTPPIATADAQTIVATPEFDPGTSLSDISRQIRSYIGEQP